MLRDVEAVLSESPVRSLLYTLPLGIPSSPMRLVILASLAPSLRGRMSQHFTGPPSFLKVVL